MNYAHTNVSAEQAPPPLLGAVNELEYEADQTHQLLAEFESRIAPILKPVPAQVPTSNVGPQIAPAPPPMSSTTDRLMQSARALSNARDRLRALMARLDV